MKIFQNTRPEHYDVKETFRLPKLEKPYEEVFHAFKRLDSLKTPKKKFDQIVVIKESICDSIDSYWKEQEVERKENQTLIDPDNLLNLFVFGLIDIRSHSTGRKRVPAVSIVI